jgi:hypothetical protein
MIHQFLAMILLFLVMILLTSALTRITAHQLFPSTPAATFLNPHDLPALHQWTNHPATALLAAPHFSDTNASTTSPNTFPFGRHL